MTENGWPPDTNAHPNVSIPLDQCVQVTIPGTTETLWFQKGWPSIIMPAFAADMNWYVESLNNSQGYNDEGTWTNGNSVGSSNHLGATAMDYNWSDHPMGPQVPDEAAGWQWSEIVGGPEEPRIRELLKYYTADDGTQLIWWGNDWDSPHDSMHFQMGYNTYQNPAVQRWIDKNINKDGTSKFKQFKASQRPDALTVLQKATGLSSTKCAAILPTLQDGLVRAQCTNKNRIAMFIAQTRHESDNYNTTIEYGQGAGKSYYPYYGRGWIQLTWQSNYQKFGTWAVQQGLISDPNQFVNNPDDVADIKWAGIVSAFFWITPHPGHNPINDDCDNGDVNAVTYTINGGYNGLDKRTAYYQQALAVGDNLLALVETTGEDTELSGVDVDRLNLAIDKILGGGSMPALWPSRSFLATDGNGVDDTVGMILNTDGNLWTLVLTMGYLAGEPLAVQQVEDVAQGIYPEGSFADSNDFVKQYGQAYCRALVDFKHRMLALFATAAAPEGSVVPQKKPAVKKPAAKKTAVKKTVAKKTTTRKPIK